MTAEFIASQRTGHGVPHAVSLRALDVAPSTFYKHHNRPPTQMRLRRQATDAEVEKAFDRSQGTYGSPRVRAQLRRDGVSVSKKTVEASMARQGLCARPKRSTGRTGNALDNAPAESFFSTLQHELIDRHRWTTRAQARQHIAIWISGWYNQHRLHSAIGMIPPIEYELTHTPDPQNQPLHN